MTRLIGAEVFKLRTTRTFYGLVIGALGLVLLIVVLATATSHKGDVNLRDAIGISGFAQVFALLLGIICVTGEFRHGTITPSLLIVPDRLRLTVAKLGAAALTGLVLGIVATGLAALIAGLILDARGVAKEVTGSQELKMVIGGIVATGLYAALGVAVGAIVRNQVGAIVGSLVYLFILENLLTIAKPLRDPVAKYGFSGLGNGLTGTSSPNADHPPLHQVPAGLLLAAYCAVLFIIGIVLMRRRDVTA
jgi:ABC-2 type transport system permease protein